MENELKVYVLPSETDEEKVLTDEEFMEKAEEAGSVYSLEGFEEAFNNGEVSGRDFIRII